VITKDAVEALKPGEIIWDGGKGAVVGFAARRQKGSAVSYLIKYTTRDGRQRWYTIGRHGSPWTLEEARAVALQTLAAIKRGGDPASDRAAARTAITVAELADCYLTEHVETKRQPRTARNYRDVLNRFILPDLGRKRAREVTRQDVAALHHANRATPTQANRMLAVLSAMFNFAERREQRPDGTNPCRHVERFPERKRERFLSADEMARLGKALAVYERSPLAVAAIRLLVFTGARLDEVLGLKWEWIDFGRSAARLPDSKTGAKTLHLPPPALEILGELPRRSDYVLGAKRGTTFIEAPWRRIRAAAGLDDVRLHDLRHSFASVAATGGMGLPIIGKMLGHTQAQTTQRYAHLASDPVKEAAATVAARIAAAMKGGAPEGGQVVPLRPEGS
jgi:integrase